jgi:hypothetical protein
MPAPPEPRVTVVVHAPAKAFAPGVQSALVRLGYNLITPRTAASLGCAPGPGTLSPTLRIVDDRELERVPVETGPDPLPIVLLTRHRGDATMDARAVGTVRRRARLQPLYEILQRVTEPHPRSVPRTETDLPVHALRDGRCWAGAIRSLSEKGCRVRGTRGLERDLRVDLSFPIPGTGMVEIPAQARAVRDDHAILVFRGASAPTREAIAGYVAQRLAASDR